MPDLRQPTAPSEVTIAVLLPEVLGTYSDVGNATVLQQRLRWRGIRARVLHCPADKPPPTTCEIYLLGGGEDLAQLFAVAWLRRHRALLHALATTGTTLAVCAGMQILGQNMLLPDGRRHDGAGLLDITTAPGRRRAIGAIVTQCQLSGIGQLCGFENHNGTTTLGPRTKPLGRIISGVGNGVLTEHIIGTYLHGPVLARNPALADHILVRTVGHALPALELPEQAALRASYLG
jgi:CobQ-like glutamine amidotransferase family enzyme